MFTGLVEALGVVRSIEPEPAGVRLAVEHPAILSAALGESVSLNGCCLTVVDLAPGLWTFQAGRETLSRTNLGRLQPGDPVNLERALLSTGRLGGHIVQGHIDGTGTVLATERNGEWIDFWVKLPPELAAQLVEKGSVAVDGVSLTVVSAERDRFSVALIPHTLAVTTLARRGPGDLVNIETDILGKYVHQFLSARGL